MCSPSHIYCFICYKKFSKAVKSEQCKECGDFKCPHCDGCLCTLTLNEKRVVMAMIRTYEPVIGKNYDFSVHSKIEKMIKKESD